MNSVCRRPSGSLTPSPSPNGEGSDYRGYPYFAACVVMLLWSYLDTFIVNHQHLTTITHHPSMANPQHLMPNTQHPPLAITLCETLYAGGLLWARNRELKTSVTSVFSVRENNIQHKRKTSPRLSSVFFFSQKNTDEQNTQGFTETLSQPISQNVTATFSYNVL